MHMQVKQNNNSKDLFDLVASEILDRDSFKKIIIPSILQIFLNTDIDLQALEILFKNNKKQAAKYLKEMLIDIEDGLFLNKFYEAKKLIEDMPEGNNKNELKDFLRVDEGENSYIYKFLKLLEDKKKACASLTEKKDVEDVISYFSNKEYETFHDWYWELTSKSTQ